MLTIAHPCYASFLKIIVNNMDSQLKPEKWKLQWDFFKASISNKFPQMNSPRYVPETGDRDLRIDFMRGVAMTILLIVHFEFYSWYNLLVWERVGILTGAGPFVSLSGIVLGMIYKRKLATEDFKSVAFKMIGRGLQLYRVNLFIAFSVYLLSLIPIIDTKLLTVYINEYTHEVFPLFPTAEMPFMQVIGHLLLLKSNPPYTQILGLYTILLLLAPVALWLLKNNKTGILLGLSFFTYFVNQAYPSMPTGSQFEYAFPLLSWQVLFFIGMAVGYNRDKLEEFWAIPLGKIAFGITFLICLGLFFFAQNTPNPNVPDWSKLHMISAETYRDIYEKYFAKDILRIGRVINVVAFLVVAYWALTKYWRIITDMFGRFFIPLGQASLYVFIVHLYLILALYNTGLINMGNNFLTIGSGNPWINTLVHTAVLFVVWYMVKKKFLFKIIPR